MTDALRHRGPDAEGHWYDDDAGIFLGHRRLSIIDQSDAGAQPMISASGRYVIIFNGEIYNFEDLRNELGSSVRYRGHSDTEVLLAALERWGVRPTIHRCAGMFAFALWDRQKRNLTLARDRIGEKPLYYGWIGATFVFASELKALKHHPEWRGEVNRDAIALLLRHNYIPAPHSIYKGILKVRPGTIVTADTPGQTTEHVFWSMAEVAARGVAEPIRGGEEQASRQLEHVLQQAVRQQTIADVPLGAFLSGGIDSSLVVALMQAQSSTPVRTFTVKFDDPAYDESAHARAVADHLKTEHTELRVAAADALAVVPALPQIYDEPFSDSSQIPTYLVSKLARQQVTVALSGDGADELFGGYPRYPATVQLWGTLGRSPQALRTLAARTLHAIPVRRWNRIFRRAPESIRERRFAQGELLHKLAIFLSQDSLELAYRRFVSHWPEPAEVAVGSVEAPTVLTEPDEWLDAPTELQRLMFLDAVSYLPDDIFVKVDRAAMAVSLETRAPFVDHRVVEFAWRLPAAFNFRDRRGKLMLRRILGRYVPASITERPKRGFAVPLGEWLRGPLREWAEWLLDERRLAQDGYFNAAAIREKWAEQLRRTHRQQYLLWNVLMFQAWLHHDG